MNEDVLNFLTYVFTFLLVLSFVFGLGFIISGMTYTVKECPLNTDIIDDDLCIDVNGQLFSAPEVEKNNFPFLITFSIVWGLLGVFIRYMFRKMNSSLY